MKIEWKSHLVGLAVVFVGITLAFMLEGWRDSKRESDLEQEYVRSFQHELRRDQVILDSQLAHAEAVQKDVSRLTEMLREGRVVQADTVTALFSGAMAIAQLPHNRSTYVSVTSSGSLNLISDYECRQRIVEYYQLLDSSELATQVSKEFVDNYLIPLFVDHLDFLTSKWTPADIVQTSRFRNLVLGYYRVNDQNIETYREIQAKRDTLADIIDRVVKP